MFNKQSQEMQHIYNYIQVLCVPCITIYIVFSMDLQRVPCVVLDQAAVSAQSDLAGATVPRRGNSTALWCLPAELAAVSTHEFVGHLHEIVSSEMSSMTGASTPLRPARFRLEKPPPSWLKIFIRYFRCVMLCCSCVSGRGSDFIMRIKLLTMEVLMM